MDNCRKEKDKCVCINVFVKCDKEDSCSESNWAECKENKFDDCCVDINVFVECDNKQI